jgi:hypothetical protein
MLRNLIASAQAISKRCLLDFATAYAYFPPPREHSAGERNMSQAMNRGHEISVQLPNGFAPIDSACPAHGSDLA